MNNSGLLRAVFLYVQQEALCVCVPSCSMFCFHSRQAMGMYNIKIGILE